MPVGLIDELAAVGSRAGQLLLGAIFLYAGVQKLRHSGEWRGVVASYRILPEPLVAAFSWLMPWAEVVIAAALCSGHAVSTAAVCAGGMLLMVSAAVAINLARGRSYIDCGCFQSSLRQTLNARLLVRNGALWVLAIVIAALGYRGYRGDRGAVDLPVTVVALSFAAVCFVLYMALNELLVQTRPAPALPSLKAN